MTNDVLRYSSWRNVGNEWPLEFFSPVEVADRRSGDIVLDVDFGLRVDELRRRFGSHVTVTSWYRTPWHDREIGGKGNHTHGWAADLWPQNDDDYHFLQIAFDMNFLGIGINDGSFIHLDNNADYLRQGKRPALWTYD